MNVKTAFRRLVTGQSVPHFDYETTKFGFQTVFYKTPYSYCICICGFEHKYFDYIKESGEINEQMYSKVVQNIVNDHCPHVKHVS